MRKLHPMIVSATAEKRRGVGTGSDEIDLLWTVNEVDPTNECFTSVPKRPRGYEVVCTLR